MPAAARPVDAVWIPLSHPASSSGKRIGAIARALFQCKEDQPVYAAAAAVDRGIFVRRTADAPAYHFPTDHDLHHNHRYLWREVPDRDGVRVGYLLPDPVQENREAESFRNAQLLSPDDDGKEKSKS